MIPAYLDDGFTTEVTEGIFCRPMLWSAKRIWKRIASESADDAWDFLRTSYVTYVGTDVLDDHKVAIIQAVCGYTTKQESSDFQDLHDSIYLQTQNPGLSTLDCQTCRTYCVDHKNGEIYIAANSHPQYLPKNAKVPCEAGGCAKVHWTNPLGMSNERWSKTWRHYWLFKDNQKMMQDPIFLRNAALIRWIVDYGRDRRFDPFAGGSSNGGAANVKAEEPDRPIHHRTCGSGGGCSAGACGTGCKTI
jgi:hypothetical protein